MIIKLQKMIISHLRIEKKKILIRKINSIKIKKRIFKIRIEPPINGIFFL